MSPPASLLDLITRRRWFQRNGLRRTIFGVIAAILAVLSLFPRQQVATVVLAPQETNTAGLAAILAQLGGGSYAAFLANTLPVEVDLAIARSYDVQKATLRKLGVKDDETTDAFQDALDDLTDQTEIDAIRGNLVQISVKSDSGVDAMKTVEAYTQAMRDRLVELSRASTNLKQSILEQRYRSASDRLNHAKDAITVFRAKNKLVDPDAQVNIAISQLATLQGQLQAKQVQLEAALKFNTRQSFEVQTLQAQVAVLKKQIAAAEGKVRSRDGMTAAGIASKSLEYERLARELAFSQALQDAYERYLEGTAIENMTATYNLREIQTPYLEPGLHFRMLPAALFTLIIAFALASEFIIMRPPPGIFTRNDDD
ncbi:hypothetical protein RXV95_02610 [Novosphingobium sp. ZN18A2]|uniref:hypothetical protein n=1 Tax=Novosphingobium sp. ZN18A2 TaxID=3079861 RepID=UPI0030CB96BA